MIEHQTILEILRHKGCGDKWIGLIQDILSFGTSSILLNWVPGKPFHCRRGLRQGDPLSPLLFVLAADLLQSVINDAKTEGRLNLPIPTNASSDFPVIQYADDTLLRRQNLISYQPCLIVRRIITLHQSWTAPWNYETKCGGLPTTNSESWKKTNLHICFFITMRKIGNG